MDQIKTMPVALRRGVGRDIEVRLEEREIPEPGAGRIRVRVRACGICGTDLNPDPGDEDIWQMFGHEVAGEVSALGPGVANLQVGERIVLDSATPCGRCDECRNARQELCANIRSFFCIGSFGFAGEMIAPAVSAISCPDLDPVVACLQEPLGVAIDLARLADLEPGQNVLILGQGPIGLMALALARRAGARRVFVSDFADRTGRKRVAEAFGADAYIDPKVTPIAGYDFGCAIDRILVTAPPMTLPSAFAVARKGAIISFIGIAHGDGAFCRFDANAFHFKKLQLRASFASPALFGPMALQMLRDGTIDGKALISHRFPLAEIARALRVARDDPAAVKVVVE